MRISLVLLAQCLVLLSMLDTSCAILTSTADKTGKIQYVVKNTDGSLVAPSKRHFAVEKRDFNEEKESEIAFNPDSPVERFKRIDISNVNSEGEKPLVRMRREDLREINDIMEDSPGRKTRKKRDISGSDQPLLRVKRNLDDPLERTKRDFPDQPLEWVKLEALHRAKRSNADKENHLEMNEQIKRSKRAHKTSADIEQRPLFDVGEYIQKMHREKRSAEKKAPIHRSKKHHK